MGGVGWRHRRSLQEHVRGPRCSLLTPGVVYRVIGMYLLTLGPNTDVEEFFPFLESSNC
jgi:hypothetical protein